MKKLLILPLLSVALVGCAKKPAQTLVRTEQVVIIPDRTLFECPSIRRYPNPETLTDSQVAELMINLQSNNTKCQKNINAIWKTLQDNKAEIEKRKT